MAASSSGRGLGGLAAATALIVSIASLFIAWRQSVVMERQLAASVWPSLAYSHGNHGDDGSTDIGMHLYNGGIGPARIRTFHLAYAGKPVKNAWAFLEACCGPVPSIFPLLSQPIVGQIVPAGQSALILGLERNAQTEAVWDKLDKARFHAQGSVCYCSALDQCWSLDLEALEPTSVARCPPR